MFYKRIVYLLLFTVLCISEIHAGFEKKLEDISVGESGLNERCYVDKNCRTKQMKCQGSVCVCLTNHIHSNDNRDCIATVQGDCFEPDDCTSLSNSYCDLDENICICSDGYVANTDNKKCLPVVSYQGTCEETIQCAGVIGRYGICSSNKCTCQNGFHYGMREVWCLQDVQLNGRCDNSSVCVTNDQNNDHVACKNGACGCEDGFNNVDNTCRDGASQLKFSILLLFIYGITKIVFT